MPRALTMWSTVTPASAAAATTLALLDEYVIFNLTADSSGQLYTKTDEIQKRRMMRGGGGMSAQKRIHAQNDGTSVVMPQKELRYICSREERASERDR